MAAYEQAGPAYQQAVLQGLQNVADTLRALEADEAALAARSGAGGPRRGRRYRITLGRYNAGGVSQIALLDAERQRRQAPRRPGARREAGRSFRRRRAVPSLGRGVDEPPAAAAR